MRRRFKQLGALGLLAISSSVFSVELPVPDRPSQIAVADLNLDGHQDIVVGTDGGPLVFILPGTGTGAFSPAVHLAPIGSLVTGIGIGDFNLDNLPDLVVVDYSDSAPNPEVVVLLGAGGLTFEDEQRYEVGSWSAGVAVGDLDDDGNLDLAITNNGRFNDPTINDDIAVLRGAPDGVFQLDGVYESGINPSGIVITELNGDGFPDLAVVNTVSDDISLYPGTFGGSFDPQWAVPQALLNNGDIVATDFDHDSHQDLAVINWPDDLVILFGNGDMTFSERRVAEWSGFGTASLITGDVDSDGHPDLVVTNRGAKDVSVLFGKGNGQFWTEERLPVGTAPEHAAIGDFNENGRNDLAVGNFLSITVSVLLDVGPSLPRLTFDQQDVHTMTWPPIPGSLSYNIYRGALSALVDGDDDGLPDAGYGSCLTPSDPDPSDTAFMDATLPPAGDGFFYVGSVVDSGGESSLGTTSLGLPRQVAVACP